MAQSSQRTKQAVQATINHQFLYLRVFKKQFFNQGSVPRKICFLAQCALAFLEAILLWYLMLNMLMLDFLSRVEFATTSL